MLNWTDGFEASAFKASDKNLRKAQHGPFVHWLPRLIVTRRLEIQTRCQTQTCSRFSDAMKFCNDSDDYFVVFWRNLQMNKLPNVADSSM
jgi:hypothetical protein